MFTVFFLQPSVIKDEFNHLKSNGDFHKKTGKFLPDEENVTQLTETVAYQHQDEHWSEAADSLLVQFPIPQTQHAGVTVSAKNRFLQMERELNKVSEQLNEWIHCSAVRASWPVRTGQLSPQVKVPKTLIQKQWGEWGGHAGLSCMSKAWGQSLHKSHSSTQVGWMTVKAEGKAGQGGRGVCMQGGAAYLLGSLQMSASESWVTEVEHMRVTGHRERGRPQTWRGKGVSRKRVKLSPPTTQERRKYTAAEKNLFYILKYVRNIKKVYICVKNKKQNRKLF